MLFRLKHQLQKRIYSERYEYLSELLKNQRLSRLQLQHKHDRTLSEIISYAVENTEFYKRKYQGHRLAGECPVDMQSIPILDKNEVIENRDSMVSSELDKSRLRIGYTGGSTGKTVSYYYDKHKHELMRAGMCRNYMWSGWLPGQKILNFWGAKQDIKSPTNLIKRYEEYITAEKTIGAYEYAKSRFPRTMSWPTFPTRLDAGSGLIIIPARKNV